MDRDVGGQLLDDDTALYLAATIRHWLMTCRPEVVELAAGLARVDVYGSSLGRPLVASLGTVRESFAWIEANGLLYCGPDN